MNRDWKPVQREIMHQLRWEWGGYVLLGLTFLLAFFLILHQFWAVDYAWHWLALAGMISIYQFIYLFAHLKENRLKSEAGGLFPNLGLANWITITRAMLNAALAGFLLSPRPEGLLVWVPSLLYLVSALMDFADGIAARVTGRMTVLGEMLDMHWDGVGVLIASLLAVLYGQAPVLYLLVGLARYLFLFGQWLRKRQGLPIYDLPPNRIRRPFAGVQMMFIAVILMPLYTSLVTRLVAWVFMLPFLLNFFVDWLAVSGVFYQPLSQTTPRRRTLASILGIAFPLAVRTGLVFLLVELFVHVINQQPLDLVVLVVAAGAAPCLLIGAAGRISALAVLLMAGFGLQVYPLEWRFWAILVFSAISMMVGTGRFSLWTPEDWLLFKQVGGKRPTARA
jgi:CDP-diacylglycerol---glycerol-3-phosphate 3-phosphatidyltransferase